MTDGSNARDRVHIKYCPDVRCMIEVENPGNDCLNLDFLLNLTEEQALHQATEKVLGLHMDAVLKHGAAVGQGLALAVKEIDPYKRHADGLITRKSDGTTVRREDRPA